MKALSFNLVTSTLPNNPRCKQMSKIAQYVKLLFLSPFFGTLFFAGPAFADSFACKPSAKNDCSIAGCTLETEGFQHAEAFYYNNDGPAIGACLWTVCYTGKANRFLSSDGKQTTLIGQLDAEHSPQMYPPLLVSITIDQQLRFSAIWHFSGESLTIDHGVCAIQLDATQ